ncbi:MAG: DUF1634 domain-containing protein [Dehalococcoidia bacterium]
MDRVPAAVLAPTPASAQATVSGDHDHPMERWISLVLRVGALISGAIIALGLTLLMLDGPGPHDPRSLSALRSQGGGSLPVHPLTVAQQAVHGQAAAIIQVGVLALILTPVLRVAMTLALFVVQRDRVFEAVTAIVLIVLLMGLIGVGS